MTAIYKREMSVYFKTPTMYIIMAVYAFFSAILFLTTVVFNLTSYMGEYFSTWLFIVETVIIAILSMRFFSEEKKNKTDQLLLTAPIGLYSLVIGKYLAALTVYLFTTMINVFYVGIIAYFGAVDYGVLLANVIGTLLVGATMIAVALSVSVSTESPIVSAAGSFFLFFLLFVLDFVGSLLPSWLGKIVSSLSLFGMYYDFTNGIVSLSAVLYYLSLTAAFVFFTVRIIEKRRWS